MKINVLNKPTISKRQNLVLICDEKTNLTKYNLSKHETSYIKKEWGKKHEIVIVNQFHRLVCLVMAKKNKKKNLFQENLRVLGNDIASIYKEKSSLLIVNLSNQASSSLFISEGISLGSYQYLKHKTTPNPHRLQNIYLYQYNDTSKINELNNIIQSVYITRNLINEPFSHLNATDLANEAKKIGKNAKYKTTIFNKKKIKSLKMGGLLAVNKGSIDDPSFTIIEWKPKNSKNKKPIVLVGKGIVYDTGGLSLKPTANSMDLMKIDMGGAGTVIGAMNAIALNKTPCYVIGLLPATDNRPSGNAYAPGDVITIHGGKTVEVLNTDAEGRLILADALSYAKKFNPKLVIDLATLTGSAVATIGHYGMVSMHKNADTFHEKLKKCGEAVHERLAELPFWDDYDKLIDSDIADVKNLGGPHAGAITAGKFLSHFIDYPWIHIDLSCVYSKETFSYRGKGATGMGVRLLYNYIKQLSS